MKKLLVAFLLFLLSVPAFAQSSTDTRIGTSNWLGIPDLLNGDIFYWNLGQFRKLDIGTVGQVLTVGGDLLPAWGAGGGGGGGTVTSVGLQDINLPFITVSNSPVTTNGTLTQTANCAAGDLIYGLSTNSLAKLGIGTNGQVLTVSSGLPAWETPSSGTGTVTSVGTSETGVSCLSFLATPNPITGAGTIALGALGTTGDLPYVSATNTISNLGIGSSGQVLTVSAGKPAWATPSGGMGTVTSITAAEDSSSPISFTASPNPITGVGTLTCVGVGLGGSIPYFITTNQFRTLAVGANAGMLLNVGASNLPEYDYGGLIGEGYANGTLTANSPSILYGAYNVASSATLPQASACPGKVFIIFQPAIGTTTLTAHSGDTIYQNTPDTTSTTKVLQGGEAIILQTQIGGGGWSVISDVSNFAAPPDQNMILSSELPTITATNSIPTWKYGQSVGQHDIHSTSTVNLATSDGSIQIAGPGNTVNLPQASTCPGKIFAITSNGAGSGVTTIGLESGGDTIHDWTAGNSGLTTYSLPAGACIFITSDNAENPNTWALYSYQQIPPPPPISLAAQGRLTITSGGPYANVSASTSTSSATVYYTPAVGNIITLYNGTSEQTQTFSEASINMGSEPDGDYDIYATSSGTSSITLSAVQWTNDTTPPTRDTQDGRLVKHSAPGSLLVGAVRVVGGLAYDWSGERWVSNLYNSTASPLLAQDPTTSWVEASTTFTPANGAATDGTNQVSVLSCVANQTVAVRNFSNFDYGSSGTTVPNSIGIGLDSITTVVTQGGADSATNSILNASCSFNAPQLGYHTYTRLEQASIASNTTFFGATQGFMEGVCFE
jgi:hypothetical protein